MTRLTNPRREYLALAVLHDHDSADEIVVYYDCVNGLGFRLKHRLQTFFYVQNIAYRVPEKWRSLSQPVVFYRIRDEGLRRVSSVLLTRVSDLIFTNAQSR